MTKFIKKYWIFGVLSALMMVLEVTMDLVQPQMMSTIVDEGVLGLSNGGVSDLSVIANTGIRMVVLLIFGGIGGVSCTIFENLCSQNFAGDVRKALFERIMNLSMEQVEKFSPGSLITRVTNDVNQIQLLVRECVRGIVRTLLLLLGGIFCMLMLDLSFGILIACMIPIVTVAMYFFISRSSPKFTILQEKLDHVNTVLQENVSGARVVKAYVKEPYETDRFHQANDELVDTQERLLIFLSYMTPLMNIIMNLAVVLVIRIGGIRVEAGAMTPGTVMAAITYITQILNATLRMAMIFQSVSRGMASMKRVREILDCEPAITDGSGTAAQAEAYDRDGRPAQEEALDRDGRPAQAEAYDRDGRPAQAGAPDRDGRVVQAEVPDRDGRVVQAGTPDRDGRPAQAGAPDRDGRATQVEALDRGGRSAQAETPDSDGRSAQGGTPEAAGIGGEDGSVPIHGSRIEFQHVSFAYSGTTENILSDINLEIAPGETIGIMGMTGCGKSTLVQLILRLYDVTEGRLLIDGQDVRDYPVDELRQKVAIAMQKSEIFAQSIEENIRMGRREASDAQVYEAAAAAQATEFIERMPEGMQTQVTQSGTSLSGGQKQRVAIARAILRQAPILILDDATSALDLKTEANLFSDLERKHAGQTRIIVAQRIASVRHADRILILDQRKIAACGTHEELLGKSRIYREICQSQMGEQLPQPDAGDEMAGETAKTDFCGGKDPDESAGMTMAADVLTGGSKAAACRLKAQGGDTDG